jgi:hypothetical protein
MTITTESYTKDKTIKRTMDLTEECARVQQKDSWFFSQLPLWYHNQQVLQYWQVPRSPWRKKTVIFFSFCSNNHLRVIPAVSIIRWFIIRYWFVLNLPVIKFQEFPEFFKLYEQKIYPLLYHTWLIRLKSSAHKVWRKFEEFLQTLWAEDLRQINHIW